MKRRSSATGLNERCTSPIIKRTKVQAQRKFAQGSSNYVTTPTKLPKPNDSSSQPFSPETISIADNDDRELNNFSNLPTIDDFLTFLCYRETDVLPQRLNYLNTPQFETIPTKKKTSKSNSTSSSSLASSKSNVDHDKASDKVNSNFKNIKKVPEYPLRSNKEITCKPNISKTSRSLALKHNQRLRKIVQTKFTENKLPNFKTKPTLNKFPTSKSTAAVKVNNGRNHTITRATSVVKESPKVVEPEVKRVTRRNSNLSATVVKSDVVKTPVKKSPAKSILTPAPKEISRPFLIPIQRVPITINTNTSSMKTRSTRSATARLESKLKTPSTSSRPTRKTKEAATLYMETLGKDLLRGDESFDEDDLLIEDYLELPSIDPAKSKKPVKEPSKKPKAIDSVKRKPQKLNKKLPNKKTTNKVLNKIHKPVKKIIKKDRAQIEKLNDELKKIVEDKPLKEKFECITKKINIDKELQNIGQTSNTPEDAEVNHLSKTFDESAKSVKEQSSDDSLEIIQHILIPNKEIEKVDLSKNYDSIENIDIPDFIVNTKDELENIDNRTLQKEKQTEEKIKNNVILKDELTVQNIENIVLRKDEVVDEKIDDVVQQKEKNTSNAISKNCFKKSSEKIGKLEIPTNTKKNCSKKLVEKVEKLEVPKLLTKNCFAKPTEISENAVLISTSKNHLKKSTEKIDKAQVPLKKSLEKVEKSVVVKKLAEKVEKPETLLKKSAEKLDKPNTPTTKNVLKKTAEKIEEPEISVKKPPEKIIKLPAKNVLKKPAQKLEDPEIPLKKPPEKIIKLDNSLKNAIEKTVKPEVALKKSVQKIETSEIALKKLTEEILKPEDELKKIAEKTVKPEMKKIAEKTEKSEVTVKKLSEKTVAKPEVALKKLPEKIKKPEVVLKKPDIILKKLPSKIIKPIVPMKKTAEKSDKPEVPLKKPVENKPEVSLKSVAEKTERPEVPPKKPAEKIEKPEVHLKKPIDKTEKPEVPNTSTKHGLKKSTEKVEKPIVAPKQKILVSSDKDTAEESQKLEKDQPLKMVCKAKHVEKSKPDSNFTPEESKISEKTPSTKPECQSTSTKRVLNRKESSVKIIRAKPMKSDSEKPTISEVDSSKTTKVGESMDESETNKEHILGESTEESVETKSMPKLVFANGKSTMTEECSQKPIIQTMAASSNKIFCLESKKLIFKKNKSPAVVEEKEDSSRKTEAFSADNENSVYAFEPDLPTTSPPFKRLKPVTPPKSLISGNSIAVQVNFDNSTKIECSSSSETQVSSTTDCEDRVFYIPIQTSDTSSTLGVAVKLDTDGPNQKIIMSATLVTKSPSFTTSTATTVAARPINSERSTSEVVEQSEIPKKPSSKENPDKVVATADSQSSSRTSTDSPSSTVVSPKSNKKVSSTTKPNQSVKIVKINKVKKPVPPKPKPKPVKAKSSKSKATEVNRPTKSTSSNEVLEAPTFYPTEAEFNDPLKYIDTIRPVAEKFGLCRIVPPSTFRPECKVADEMRFTAYNQYVHKMLHRWGPNVKEMMAIRKFLATQNIQLTQAPWIGGMEVDLPKLYQMVQQCGGLKAVIEKEKWHQVADVMKIPKLAQDRITKLDDIYCKYLLPYDILSHNEREKLFEEVEKDWNAHLENPSDDEDILDDVDECIVKGRTMPLSCFYRIARNTMMMCFGSTEGQGGPSTETIETEFWNHVSQRKAHICVHSGSIDTGEPGYGFSVAKNSTFRKHPWNLKVLTNNSSSILRSLGPIMGVTVPTLHVGMLYSACCWYRDPHGLPWVEYLHTGANKIWYGIPDEYSEQFNEAMRILVPRYCRDKKLWLPSDTVMIPPPLLVAQNVPLSRVVQQPGQFIVVFPKAFTSCISTGYMVSESVYFAHASWLNSAKQIFSDMQESCEPSVFSLEQLLISVATDVRASLLILEKILPLLIEVRNSEVLLRNQLTKLGLNASEKMKINKKRKSKASFNDEDNYECEICRSNLFVSLVINSHEQTNYCLKHATNLLQKKPSQVKYCKLMYAYTEEELDDIIKKVQDKIETKGSRKPNMK